MEECEDEWMRVAEETKPRSACVINWHRGVNEIYYSQANFIFMLEQYEEAALDGRIRPLFKAFTEENYLQLISESYSVLKTCVVIAAEEMEKYSKSLLEFLKIKMEEQNTEVNY